MKHRMARGMPLALATALSVPLLVAQKPLIPGQPPPIQGWTDWKQTLVEKFDPLSGQPSFTWDDRFEYRWKQNQDGSGRACAVEIRPAGDQDQWYQLAELDVLYHSPDHSYAPPDSPLARRKPQLHSFTTSNVTVRNRQAHATINASDCGAVVAVTAGRFDPAIAIPVR